jgi:geranylgeranyl pyrophosphate synthase
MSGPSEVAELAGAHVSRGLERVETRLRDVAAAAGGPVAGWAGSTIAAGGKRLRPMLVLLAAGDDTDDAVRAGVAVELVHAATLVHDDVLDAAPLRRGVPTVWSTAGREAAVVTGDHLFARAFSELEDLEHVRILSGASTSLAAGELLQREDAWTAIGEDRYLRRCMLKTAALFEAACAMGDPRLAGFGRSIGLAFQILDDVLDVTGPPERTGKHRGTDLLDGTFTLPMIYAGLDLDLRAITTPEEAERVCDAIAATDALDRSRARALELVGQAKAALPEGLPARAAFELAADGVVERYS